MFNEVVAEQHERMLLNFVTHLPEYLPALHAELQGEDFSDPVAREAFDATHRLVSRGIDVTLLSLRQELATNPAAFGAILAADTTGMVYSEFAPAVALVAEQSRRRHTLKVLRVATSVAMDGGTEAEVFSALSGLGSRSKLDEVTMKAALAQFTATHLDTERRGWIAKSCWAELDEIVVEGFGPGELILIGGRPGMGKTAAATQLIHHIAVHYGDVGVVSLEMSAPELAGRIASQRLQVNIRALTAAQLHAAASELDGLGIKFYDKPMTLSQLNNLAMAFKARHPKMAAFFIDYGGLVLPDAEDRRKPRIEQLEILTRTLKVLAKRLGVPLFALQQLSRDGANRRPTLTDLRGSGSWEQDADTVILLHRAGYYDGALPQDDAEIIVAKNRDGWDGVTTVRWERSTASFLSNSNTWAPPIAPDLYSNEMDVPF